MEMSIDDKYKKAFSEVLEVLKYIPTEEYSKIPKEWIKMFNECSYKDSTFKIDNNLSFGKINLSEITNGILVNLYNDFWVSEKEGQRIKKNDNLKRILSDKQKKKKYSPEYIFNKKEKIIKEEKVTQNAMIEYKKGIVTKIIYTIKRILHVR